MFTTIEEVKTINQIKHKVYTRNGYDLFAHCEITLDEARNGFERKFYNLDGQSFKVKFKKRSIYIYYK